MIVMSPHGNYREICSLGLRIQIQIIGCADLLAILEFSKQEEGSNHIIFLTSKENSPKKQKGKTREGYIAEHVNWWSSLHLDKQLQLLVNNNLKYKCISTYKFITVLQENIFLIMDKSLCKLNRYIILLYVCVCMCVYVCVCIDKHCCLVVDARHPGLGNTNDLI